jgi:hypothetical protein
MNTFVFVHVSFLLPRINVYQCMHVKCCMCIHVNIDVHPFSIQSPCVCVCVQIYTHMFVYMKNKNVQCAVLVINTCIHLCTYMHAEIFYIRMQ